MDAALQPYDQPIHFEGIEVVPCFENLINLPLPANIWSDDLEDYQGVKGHINLAGQVHIGAILSSERKLLRFDDWERCGKRWIGPTPRYIQHPHTGIWFRIGLPNHINNFLTSLVNAEGRGLVFSGNTPDATYNDCRKWATVLRQLGIVISTTLVPQDKHGIKGNLGHRFTIHSRVAISPPNGVVLGNLYTAARKIVEEFRSFKKLQAQAAGAKTTANIDWLCDRYPQLDADDREGTETA